MDRERRMLSWRTENAGAWAGAPTGSLRLATSPKNPWGRLNFGCAATGSARAAGAPLSRPLPHSTAWGRGDVSRRLIVKAMKPLRRPQTVIPREAPRVTSCHDKPLAPTEESTRPCLVTGPARDTRPTSTSPRVYWGRSLGEPVGALAPHAKNPPPVSRERVGSDREGNPHPPRSFSASSASPRLRVSPEVPQFGKLNTEAESARRLLRRSWLSSSRARPTACPTPSVTTIPRRPSCPVSGVAMSRR